MIIPSYKFASFSPKTGAPSLSFLYADDQGVLDFYQKILFQRLGVVSVQNLTQEDVVSAKKPLVLYLDQDGFFSKRQDLLIKSCTDKIVPFVEQYLEDQKNRAVSGKVFIQAGYLKPASKLRKLLEKEDSVLVMPCYAPDVRDIMTRVQAVFKTKTPSQLNREALQTCAARLSETLYAFESSLDMLAQYCWGKDTITKEDVEAVLVSETQGRFETFLTAFIQRNPDAIVQSLKMLFQDGHNVISQVRLLSFFMHRFLTLKAFMDQGEPFEMANKKIPMPFNFFQIKTIKPQVTRWTLERCQDVLKRLEQIERTIKLKSYLEAEDLFLQELITLTR